MLVEILHLGGPFEFTCRLRAWFWASGVSDLLLASWVAMCFWSVLGDAKALLQTLQWCLIRLRMLGLLSLQGWTFGLFLLTLSAVAAAGLLTTDWVSGASVTTAFKVNGVPRSLGVKSKLFCGWCSSGNEAGNLKQRTWSWMWKILNEQSKPQLETGTRNSRFSFKITNYEYSTWVPTFTITLNAVS